MGESIRLHTRGFEIGLPPGARPDPAGFPIVGPRRYFVEDAEAYQEE